VSAIPTPWMVVDVPKTRKKLEMIQDKENVITRTGKSSCLLAGYGLDTGIQFPLAEPEALQS
jgi:hypothetical protein